MDILDSVAKDFDVIDKAAKEFGQMILDDDVRKSIAMAAELAGLKLLRASKVDFSKLEPGAVLLGAISDETYQVMESFVVGWAKINHISTFMIFQPKIPNDMLAYNPQVTQFEKQFTAVCDDNAVKEEYYPFAAATTALRFVHAAKGLRFLNPKLGIALILYHLNAASKTVPYPAEMSEG